MQLAGAVQGWLRRDGAGGVVPPEGQWGAVRSRTEMSVWPPAAGLAALPPGVPGAVRPFPGLAGAPEPPQLCRCPGVPRPCRACRRVTAGKARLSLGRAEEGPQCPKARLLFACPFCGPSLQFLRIYEKAALGPYTSKSIFSHAFPQSQLLKQSNSSVPPRRFSFLVLL